MKNSPFFIHTLLPTIPPNNQPIAHPTHATSPRRFPTIESLPPPQCAHSPRRSTRPARRGNATRCRGGPHRVGKEGQ